MTDTPNERATEGTVPVASKSKSAKAVASTVAASRGVGFDFFSSVIAGFLIGLFVDWIAGTSPIGTIVGIVLGFVAGFYKLWLASAVLEAQAAERRNT